MKLPDRQRYALQHPLVTTFSANSRQFAQIVHKGQLRLSTLLTIDRSETGYHWHASVSILGSDGKPIPFLGNVSSEEFEAAMDYAVLMLEAVGSGELSTIKPDAVIHLFKDLSPEESKAIKQFSVANN